MRQVFKYFILSAFITVLFSCRKENDDTKDCFANALNGRQITDKPAIITLTNGQYYIEEEGTIDTRLKPCNLTTSFQISGLHVTISGITRSISQSGSVCCIEGFVITKIRK